jgi:hypothetical protein
MYNAWCDISGQTEITEPDTLPPLDLSLVFVNERQEVSRVLIRGLEILDRANNISVQDVQLSEVYSFLAISITNLTHEERGIKPAIAGMLQSQKTPQGANSIGITKTFSTTSTTTESTTATTGTTGSTTSSPPTTTTTESTTTASTTTPCVSNMAGQTSFSLSLSSEGWYDTGLTIAADQYLYATATGSGRWDATYGAYPEGSYYPNPTYSGYYPPHCITSYAGVGSWAADSCRPFSLVLAVKTDGTGAPGRGITYGLQPNREAWFGGQTGRIWAQFNDRSGSYGDNAGSFNVHLEIWDLCEATTTLTLTVSSASTTPIATTTATTPA